MSRKKFKKNGPVEMTFYILWKDFSGYYIQSGKKGK